MAVARQISPGQVLTLQYGVKPGATAPVRYSVIPAVSGQALPSGLQIDSSSGLLTWTAPASGLTDGVPLPAVRVVANNCTDEDGAIRSAPVNYGDLTLTPTGYAVPSACPTVDWSQQPFASGIDDGNDADPFRIIRESAWAANNVWNIQNPLVNSTQEVSLSPRHPDGSYTFCGRWDYTVIPPRNNTGTEILAFPGVQFGQPYGFNGQPPHPGLPVRLADMQAVSVSYESTDGAGTTRGWLASDMRIQQDCSVHTPWVAGSGVMIYEFLVILERYGGYSVASGTPLGTHTIDGRQWQVFDRPGAETFPDGSPVRQITFQPVTDPANSVDMKPLLDWAIAGGHMPLVASFPNACFTNVNVGVEIESGATVGDGYQVNCLRVDAS